MTRPLKVGDYFRMHPDTGDKQVYQVLRISAGSLAIRAVRSKRTEFQTHDGKDVGFDSPGQIQHIALRPLGITILRRKEKKHAGPQKPTVRGPRSRSRRRR